MASDLNIHWTGVGRWLAFVGAAFLILLAVPLIFDRTMGAVAGWNIFLGLLLFGAVASDNARAPTVALVVAILMAIRLIVAATAGGTLIDIGVGATLLLLVGSAAWELRKQKSGG